MYTCGRHDNKANTKCLLDRLKHIEDIVGLLWCLCLQPSHRCYSSPCIQTPWAGVDYRQTNRQTSRSLCILTAAVGHRPGGVFKSLADLGMTWSTATVPCALGYVFRSVETDSLGGIP